MLRPSRSVRREAEKLERERVRETLEVEVCVKHRAFCGDWGFGGDVVVAINMEVVKFCEEVLRW